MEKDISTILAVNLGSRYVGFAVFRDEELLDWRVSSIGTQSLKAREQNLEKLLSMFKERHGINTVVLKQLHPSRCSKELSELVEFVKEYASVNRLRLVELSLEQMKGALIRDGRSNKHNLMEIASSCYSFLKPLYQKQRQSKHPYLIRMFEAVALGMVALSKAAQGKAKARL